MTDPKTKQVTALLYPVAQTLHARPGDSIMVVAGVVVGIYTGHDAVPIAARTTEEVKVKPPKEKPVKQGGVRTHVGYHEKRLHRIKHSNYEKLNPIVRDHADKVIAALRRHEGWITAHTLANDVYGAKEAGQPRPWQYRDALQWLRAQGMVAVRGTGRLLEYSRGPNFKTEEQAA